MIGTLLLCIVWCVGGLHVGFVLGSLRIAKNYTSEIHRLQEQLCKERLLHRMGVDKEPPSC